MESNQTKRQQIFNQYQEKHQAFSLDWKYSLDDLVFNLKDLLPNLTLESLGEKQVSGDFIESIQINSQTHDFPSTSPARAHAVIRLVNQQLLPSQKTFITHDSSGDEYEFILVDISDLPDLEKIGFHKV